MTSLSPTILSILAPFAILFSQPVWNNSLTLLVGTILCRGKRTVCAALRVMGLSHEPSFAKYHHLLNRVSWSPLSAARILLDLLVGTTGKDKPLVMFIDETLSARRERRKSKGIKLISFKEMIGMPDLGWKEVIVEGYEKKKKRLKYLSNTSL